MKLSNWKMENKNNQNLEMQFKFNYIIKHFVVDYAFELKKEGLS